MEKENEESLSFIMDQMISDFELKNKNIHEFLIKNENKVFIEKMLKYANEECGLIPLNQQELKIEETCKYKIQENYSNTGLDITFNTQQGCSPDSYFEDIYIKLPNSGKFFHFIFSS